MAITPSARGAFIAAFVVATLSPSGAALAQAVDYKVGETVEIEASKHWLACTVTETGPQVLRVRCPAYPPLSRAAGVYIAQNDPASVRRPGQGARPSAAATGQKAQATPQIASLKAGEYACYGSGGRIMIGLGFKVLANGRYTDLDGKNPGTFAVDAGTVTFKGGHLAGQVGRDLRNGAFRLGSQAGCEPF